MALLFPKFSAMSFFQNLFNKLFVRLTFLKIRVFKFFDKMYRNSLLFLKRKPGVPSRNRSVIFTRVLIHKNRQLYLLIGETCQVKMIDYFEVIMTRWRHFLSYFFLSNWYKFPNRQQKMTSSYRNER